MRRKAPNDRLTEQRRSLFHGIAWTEVCSLLLRLLLLAAAATAFVLCLRSVYSLSVSMDAIWKFLLLMLLLSYLMAALRRRWIWLLLFFLFAGWYAWQHAESLVQGWLLLLEQALLPMDLVLPDALRQLMQPADAVASQTWLQIALNSLLAVLVPLMAACTVAEMSVGGLLCCVLLPLLPGLVAGLVPPLFPVGLLLLVCLMLTAYKRAYRAETEPISDEMETEQVPTVHRRGAWTAAAIGMIPIVLVTLFLATKLLPEQGYERPAYARQLRDRFLELELESLFEPYNDGLSRGDLTHLSDIRFTGDAALAVRVSEAMQLYLSGYTGAVFTGTRWENPLQSAYDRDAVGFSDPMPQNLHAALSDAQPYTLSVRNINAESSVMYLPNGLATPVADFDAAGNIQDGAISVAESPKLSSYTVSALPFSTVPSVLAAKDSLSASYHAAALSAVQHADVSVQRSVENYVRYVTDTYTQLPEETRLAAERLCEQYGLKLSAESGMYDIAALCRSVREVLRTECRYVYEPQSVPSDADFATWFLQQSREGYCVHFATTAAVLLRSMGIPTRYAEGYIVIRSDYDKPQDADGFVLIEDTHAHAWAEVFDPVQMVWIPVEMTPSAGNAAQSTATPIPSADAEAAEQTPDVTEMPTQSPVPTPTVPDEGDNVPAEQTPLPEETEDLTSLPTEDADAADLPMEDNASADAAVSAQQTSKPRQFSYVLAVGLLLFGGALLWYLRKKRTEDRLKKSDPNTAVLLICTNVQRLLALLGLPSRGIGQSAEAYAAALKQELPWLPMTALANLLQMGEQAMFSAERCGERERAEAHRLYDGIKTTALAPLPPVKRMLLKLRLP